MKQYAVFCVSSIVQVCSSSPSPIRRVLPAICFIMQSLSRFGAGVAGTATPGSLAEAGLEELLKANPGMRWKLVQRGFWVHGVKSLGEYAEAAMAMTLEGRVGMIRCPTLLTTAENDPLSHGAEALLAELACPKALLRFTAAEGAGDHCEMGNRSLATLRMLDWLEGILAP